MSESWGGTGSKHTKQTTNWSTASNWSGGKVPTVSATGTQSVVIGSLASGVEPVISSTNAPTTMTVKQGATTYTDYQLDGQLITLTSGASLTLQGVALGHYGADALGNITNLTAAADTVTATYDTHMLIETSGPGVETLAVNDVNHNFGKIDVAANTTLDVAVAPGGNNQTPHGLYNYGLITVAAGAELEINTAASSGDTVGFYNAGWIEVDGGTLNATAAILDGANKANAPGIPDGYIEIGNSGVVILGGTVAAQEEVTFTDATANTLQISAGNLFAGTVNNFGPTDTIIVSGFTGTSNATLSTGSGGTTLLETTSGSVTTTITLTGSISPEILTSSISGGEVIEAGATSFGSGHWTLGSTGTTLAITNTSTITVSGSTTDMVLNDSVAGTGAYFIDNGATLAMDNTIGSDAGQTVIFGTNGSAGTLNTFIIDDNSAGFGGTITGFGANDVIDLSPSVLPSLTSGEGIGLSYTNGVLTVSETNAAGTTIDSTTLSIAGTGSLSTSSFVALIGTAGIEIETAGQASDTTFDFNDAAGTNTFSAPGNFTGGVAPGNVIAAGELVTISAGTALVTNGAITDNGTINVGTTFSDASSLTGTGTFAIQPAGHATLTGGASLTGGIIDAGTLVAGGAFAAPISLTSATSQLTISSNFTDTGAITGLGTLTVDTGVTASLAAGSTLGAINVFGTLDVLGSLTTPINMEGNGANSVVDFSGSDVTNGTLTTALTNFGTTDTIILGGSDFSLSSTANSFTETYNPTTDQLVIDDTTNGSVVTLSVTLASGDTGADIRVSTGPNGLTIDLPCDASGTRILTPEGDMLVEDLAVGGSVVTVREGGPATRKIVWTGKRSLDIARHPRPELGLPVRILAGAFAPGLPERDLRLSPHHAVYANGHLFEAISLINGVTILQEQNTRFVTYHHIELDEHDVMLAEGLPAESFLDTGNRNMFEHVSAPMALHADFRRRTMTGSACRWCAKAPHWKPSGQRCKHGPRRSRPRLPPHKNQKHWATRL